MKLAFVVIILACAPLTFVVVGLVTLWVLKQRMIEKRRDRRRRLRDCPRAEPFEPQVSLPAVVDAAVVFASAEEAQRRMAGGSVPITRVPSEVQDDEFAPVGGSGVLCGLPIGRSFRLPAARPAGAMYRLPPASDLYGRAEYATEFVSRTPDDVREDKAPPCALTSDNSGGHTDRVSSDGDKCVSDVV